MDEVGLKLCNLLDSLPQSRDKLAAVDEINLILSALSPAALKSVVPNLSFGTLFECLTLCNREDQFEMCCKVLGRLLDAVESTALLCNFHSELLIGLDSDSEIICNLCLSQVLRSVENTDVQLTPYIDIVKKIVGLIGSKSLSISKVASQIIASIGKSPDGLVILMGDQMLPCFQDALQLGDEVRFRIYECIAEIAVHSPSGLQHAVRCGFISRFLHELDRDDVLTRLNCLEILTSLVVTDHGRIFFTESGILQQFEDLIANYDLDPFGELILPGAVKLFGSLCRSRPGDVLDSHPKFCRFLFAALDGPTSSNVTGIVVETIGFIGSTPMGKLALGRRAEMPSACRSLGSLLVNAPTQLRERALEAVTHLVNIQTGDQTAELLSLTEDWFSRLTRSADDSVATILGIARQPFDELRIPSLRLINALVRLPWGLSRLVAHAGFLEYLLDRSTERGDRSGLEGKYAIVASLVASEAAPVVVPNEFFLRLREYEREGPFYAKHESQVAFESGN